MPLSPEILEEIDVHVRGGFEDHEDIVQIFCEELYEPGELDRDEVDADVARAFARLREAQKAWPAETDCDRLEKVFAELNRAGVVALQNAGHTQSDGYEDVGYELEERGDGYQAIGYCFFHSQDLERAVRGGGLYLAFGPIDPAREESDGPKIGSLVTEKLKRHGFDVVWDGGFNQRIFLPRIDWKRRS